MADQRLGGIAWTDQTWNPVRGCSRVSEGCRHCYAEQVAARFSGPGQPYEGLVRTKDGKPVPVWNGTIKLVPEHLGDPLRWRRPRRVFVNSMSDLFHPEIPDEYIAAVFGVMAASPAHTFQVLTKRPERAKAWFAAHANPLLDGALHVAVGKHFNAFDRGPQDDEGDSAIGRQVNRAFTGAADEWPLPNVWLGVSVEDQATADERIPLLLECPAAVRWVSYEPAIGAVDFRAHLTRYRYRSTVSGLRYSDPRAAGDHTVEPGIDWIVVGGESGPDARPFDLDWARDVVDAGQDIGVPVFVKQLGARPYEDAWQCACGAAWLDGGDAPCREPLADACLASPPTKTKVWRQKHDRKGGDPDEWPEDLRVRQWPAKAVTSW